MGFCGKSHNQLEGEIRETTDVTETEDQDQCPTTPTAVSVRIPRVPPCPAAPKKRKPSSKCSYVAGGREFFCPPDLETVFIQRAS
ncbi:hypothetical protein N665_1212s0001 [Sinapis alba]|nr:hypothetical protein N665_1212s0001 [Sinapis alba]